MEPVIIATHVILTGYGHWLPNDPRGSMSRELRALGLDGLGPMHFQRKRKQPTREQLQAFYKEAEKQLRYPVVWFEQTDRTTIANALGQAVNDEGLTCYACAVLRNHVHILIRRHRLTPSEILHRLETASRQAVQTSRNLSHTHPVWSADASTVYKDTPQTVRACVTYIDKNPPKHRLPEQHWPFVTDYNNWPFHKSGHQAGA